MKPLAESAPQANRPERPLEGLSQLGKAAGTVARLRPLGLRYSIVVRGTDGQERDVDAATASKSIQPIFLTVEANQDAYLQVWKTVGSSTPQLQWPEKETGQISLKIAAGQRQYTPLTMESGPAPSRPVFPESRSDQSRGKKPPCSTGFLSINSKSPSPQATKPAHKNRPPTSSTKIHNRSDRCRYYPQPVTAIAQPQ